MKIILTKQGYSYVRPIDSVEAGKLIEEVSRNCYLSGREVKEDSYKDFISGRLISNGDTPHLAMLEFYDVIVKIITNRGISHELVRHRIASYSQESTRYCSYKDSICFILPDKYKAEYLLGEYELRDFILATNLLLRGKNNPFEEDLHWWIKGIFNSVDIYNHRVNILKTAPQEARGILVEDLKTSIILKYNLSQWINVFKKRTSKKAHPQMREIMIPIYRDFKEKFPFIFNTPEIRNKIESGW